MPEKKAYFPEYREHLDGNAGENWQGQFSFAIGQDGDVIVVESCFGRFGEGPIYQAARKEFIMRKIHRRRLGVGIYTFVGEYRISRPDKPGRFVGKVKHVDVFRSKNVRKQRRKRI